MNREIQDERYHVVNEAIHDAFMLVVKDKELDRITVTDIIKKAGIVRSTFYNHYENIPALVDDIEDETIGDIISIMESFQAKSDWEICKSYFLTICEYTSTNPFFAKLLISPRGNNFFEKAITMFHNYVVTAVQRKTPVEHSREEFAYMVAGTIGSTLGILHKWSVENFKIPADAVANILTQVFMGGMLPFMS